jgi:cystathionine gamma-synthase
MPGLVLRRLGEIDERLSPHQDAAFSMDVDPETTLAQAGRALNGTNPRASSSPSSLSDAASRSQNEATEEVESAPSRRALEDTLAELDGGAGAVACSTGAAAVSTVAPLLYDDAHVLCAQHSRIGTKRHLSRLADQKALSVSYVDVSTPEALDDALQPNTEALWVETPSNPLLHVADLEALSAVADAHDLLLVVDNTVLSPILQRPIEHGADLVVYSSMQHLNGHTDAVGGAVIARTKALAETLETAADTHDTAAASFDSWLALRGAKTLPVRMRQHETNARSLAHFLDEHPAVRRVRYPALRDHPGHETARRQQDGYGAMISFFVDPDRMDVNTLLQDCEVFAPAESAGGIESSIEHPATMTHATVPHEQRTNAGITEGLIRLSVGIESTDDLTADLEQALEAARVPRRNSVRTREPVPLKA